ncbi:MAG TPA: thiol:disulfide interchange protein DsbA/DsbL [Moraxellaceae bacterium]|nr:thiol:disulfide interchange protein DsbA/DsbL [Moraxellaceae bacterium]
MFKRLFATLILSLTAVTAVAAEPAYRTLATPGHVDKPGMIEVREFFWYGCPHCYKLEPSLAAWLKTKPSDVNFVRTPAALNPVWEANARGYYAVEMMGKVEQTHQALFDAIHKGNQRLFDQDSLAGFYSNYGVNPATFKAQYNGFMVSAKVAQGRNLAQAYGLDGVPTIVVNGKYVVKGEGPEVVATINQLITKERAASRKK